MKLNSILVFLSVLSALVILSARANDVLVLDDGAEGKNSITWPMLPGESLNALAAKFYPKNIVMQRHFTAKVISLNADTMPDLDVSANFSVPTAVIIPTLKSLSSSALTNKATHKISASKGLHLSQNIASAVQHVPKSLLDEYEYLVTRNAFLKEELAKLNEKLVFLQSKMKELRLILDRTVIVSKKKTFKNLDIKIVKPKEKPVAPALPKKGLFDINTLLAVLGLILVTGLGAYLYKTNRQKFQKSLANIRPFETNRFDDAWQKTQLQRTSAIPLSVQTQVDDLNESLILEEARFLVSKGQPAEAIEHIKWSIRAKPKASLAIWMYLLEIYKHTGLKEAFENDAKEVHKLFNVMAPVWEEKRLAMVIANSLEEFPHIIERLISLWPTAPAMDYLYSLITDNRGGERSGFGSEVTQEILLLTAVLEQRGDSI